jgi:hypothetical protein
VFTKILANVLALGAVMVFGKKNVNTAQMLM